MDTEQCRVIIAEDDVKIAEIQSHFVQQVSGFEVVGLAHSIEQTKSMVEILQPNLLLLDIVFPDGNGLDLLKQLRDEKKQTDVILTTAARDVETLKSGIHGGIFDYIVKPLVFSRIEDSLKRYLQHTNNLNNIERIDQKTIDSILPHHNASQNTITNPHLPKGIDSITLQKIQELFQQITNSTTASDVGKLIGSSRTTARRYLEYLVSTGELIVDVNYGGVGRPERYYCLSK